MREFPFELTLCAHLEDEDRLVSRQLGAACHGSRVMDVVCVTPGPEFDARRAITAKRIPALAIESDVGVGTATYWKAGFSCHPDRAREVIEEAIERGFFESERRNGRRYVRQSVRYPDWYDSIVGIENKPDLDRPGALESQLLTDVKLGLLDRVILATSSHVTGAHRNRIPDEVGIWQFDPDTGKRTILREPTQLPVATPGVEIVRRGPARTEIEVVSTDAIERQRLRIAERAYGKGWRIEEFPACARIDPDEAGLPVCPWKGRIVNPAVDCGERCDGFDPAPPPAVDVASLRAERTAWNQDPPGRQRRQTGLDSF